MPPPQENMSLSSFVHHSAKNTMKRTTNQHELWKKLLSHLIILVAWQGDPSWKAINPSIKNPNTCKVPGSPKLLLQNPLKSHSILKRRTLPDLVSWKSREALRSGKYLPGWNEIQIFLTSEKCQYHACMVYLLTFGWFFYGRLVGI